MVSGEQTGSFAGFSCAEEKKEVYYKWLCVSKYGRIFHKEYPLLRKPELEYRMANETRKKILQEGLKLFRERGYSNVTVEDICESLAITRGTFYYHFRTKAAVLESIYVDHRNRSPENLSAMFSDDRWEQMWWLMKDSIRTAEELGCDLQSWLMATSVTEKTCTFHPSQRTRDILKIVITEGQRSGQFGNHSDPEVLTSAIFSIILGISTEWCNQSGEFSLGERIQKEIVALLEVHTV